MDACLERRETGDGNQQEAKADEQQEAGERASSADDHQAEPRIHATDSDTAPRIAAMPPMRSDMLNPFPW